ncbi:hypothetical protein FACS1894191_0650 [Clostridia bacterium]|nr:hypothetical protein FACS1894191_0650 [Clostridia bacterium]
MAMITSELLAALKSENISVNGALTKERVKADYTAMTAAQKKELAELSGLTKSSFYLAAKNGKATAKLVAALAFYTDTSPLWYTGEAEEKEPYSDEAMRGFLIAKGYESVLEGKKSAPAKKKAAPKAKRAATGKRKASSSPKTPPAKLEATVEPVPQVSPVDSTESAPSVPALELTDAVKLLEALYIRASVNGDAKSTLDEIKRRLYK